MAKMERNVQKGTIRRKAAVLTAVLAGAAILLGGCGTSYYRGDRYIDESGLPQSGANAAGTAMPLYYGYGEGADEEAAIIAARKDAALRAVLDALGSELIIMRDRVVTVAEGMAVSSGWYVPGTLEVVDQDYAAGSHQRIVKVRVDITAAADHFFAAGISGGQIDGRSLIRLQDQRLPVYGSSQPLSQVLPAVKADWSSGWKPVFLVLYDEHQHQNPFTARTALLGVSDVIAGLGFRYADPGQMESIRQDEEYAFVEEQGYSSLIRWAAAKLHADYYIDTAVQVTSFSSRGVWMAEAAVTLNCFNASTGAGRGSVVYRTPQPVSAATAMAAEDRAVSEAAAAAAGELMKRTSIFFDDDIRSGAEYELIIMRTPVDRTMRDFLRELQAAAREARRISYSVEETRFRIRFSGTIEEFEDAIYRAASLVPGLEDLALLYQRGNSLTFTSGR